MVPLCVNEWMVGWTGACVQDGIPVFSPKSKECSYDVTESIVCFCFAVAFSLLYISIVL